MGPTSQSEVSTVFVIPCLGWTPYGRSSDCGACPKWLPPQSPKFFYHLFLSFPSPSALSTPGRRTVHSLRAGNTSLAYSCIPVL